MSNTDLFDVLSKTYIGNKDIKQVLGVGINRANEIRQEIEKEYCDNMLLPKYKIPTKYFLEKQRIKIKDIYDLAKMERELKGL